MNTLTAVPLLTDGTLLNHAREQDLRPLADIVLPKEAQAVVDRVLLENRRGAELAALGLRPANRLLFCGPPGCGKTVTAGAIARELALPLASARLDAVIASHMGETAVHLRKIFDLAKGARMVLFLDEFDALGRSRELEDDSSAGNEMRRVGNSLLVMLEEVRAPSVVIAATNYHGALDPALWRRFDEVVVFPRPTLAQAAALLARVVGRYRPMDAAGLGAGQRRLLNGLSFAEVERVALDAVKARTLDRDLSFREALGAALGRQKVRRAMSRA